MHVFQNLVLMQHFYKRKTMSDQFQNHLLLTGGWEVCVNEIISNKDKIDILTKLYNILDALRKKSFNNTLLLYQKQGFLEEGFLFVINSNIFNSLSISQVFLLTISFSFFNNGAFVQNMFF